VYRKSSRPVVEFLSCFLVHERGGESGVGSPFCRWIIVTCQAAWYLECGVAEEKRLQRLYLMGDVLE
jgi:hypothetical protein